MIKTLTKHGNSLALVIDRAVLDLLRIDAETRLDISTDGQILIITPIPDRQPSTRTQPMRVPAASIRPGNAPRGAEPERRVPGLHAGSITTTADFDAPLPDELWVGSA